MLGRGLLLLALGLVAFAGGCGGGVSDPESARCTSPRATFGNAVGVVDHREVRVHFTCEDAVLAGTLYLPLAKGRHPAAVWVHGSGDQPRLPYEASIVTPLVQQGVAVFSYDKRGVGESEGSCCASGGHFNLLAADADGAVLAVRSHPEIDATRVGFYGASEAGWVVPLADVRLREPVAFTALVDGPAVTTGEEEVWSEAATDRFRVGSLTKTFVAAVVLQLAGERKLSLEDSVERWLPGLVPDGGHITIRQLLNMKAGLYDYPDDPRIEADFVKGNWAHKWRPGQLVEIGVSHKPLFAPGKGWSYCNTCYILAGLIVEKATGNPLGAELKRRIFLPLQLRGTSFDTERRISGRHVHGYFRDGKQLLDTSLLTPSWAWVAGAIVSTADDIADFYRALFRGQVIRPALLREMRATVAAYSKSQRYGLGLAKLPSPCGPLWGNGGDIVGYNSSAYADKTGGRQYVLFVNLDEMSFTRPLTQALNNLAITAYCG